MAETVSLRNQLRRDPPVPLLRPASRLHTAVYATLFSVVVICGAVQLTNLLGPLFFPNTQGYSIVLSAVVSGLLAPPASFVLGFYSFKLIRLQEQMHLLATTDPMTGLLNRQALESQYQRFRETMGSAVTKRSIILLDLDAFKQLNIEYGHGGGDAVIQAVSDELAEYMSGTGDLVARWSGQQFAILQTGTGAEKATRVGRALCSRIAELRVPYGAAYLRTTASIGVVECGPDELLEDVLVRADLCMERAKQTGRNKVVVYPKSAPTRRQA